MLPEERLPHELQQLEQQQQSGLPPRAHRRKTSPPPSPPHLKLHSKTRRKRRGQFPPPAKQAGLRSIVEAAAEGYGEVERYTTSGLRRQEVSYIPYSTATPSTAYSSIDNDEAEAD